ncbi:MAG TPA: DUF1232 domain-containing protein [Alphaproteobacteria bacterium]|nr:DUF1232 domain-containing protein [Alphaproteobacteria bacterium]
MRTFTAVQRLLHFRHDLVRLWRAFRNPKTPLWLKAAMVGVVVYLVSPFDLIPDFLLLPGIVDDLVLVPLLLSWIARHLPAEGADGEAADGKTIEGTARRL